MREYKYQVDTLTIANAVVAGIQTSLKTKLDESFSVCTGIAFVQRTNGGLDRSTSVKYMNMGIKNKLSHFLQLHPKISHWVWFVFLWCVGLLSAVVIALPIKALIKLASV